MIFEFLKEQYTIMFARIITVSSETDVLLTVSRLDGRSNLRTLSERSIETKVSTQKVVY